MLSVLSAKFADQAVNFLMDLLNDDAMVVRLEVLEALHHVATFDCLKVPEIHRHMVSLYYIKRDALGMTVYLFDFL